MHMVEGHSCSSGMMVGNHADVLDELYADVTILSTGACACACLYHSARPAYGITVSTPT
jgi:hypothetical protein